MLAATEFWTVVGYVAAAWALCLAAYVAYIWLFRRRRRRV